MRHSRAYFGTLMTRGKVNGFYYKFLCDKDLVIKICKIMTTTTNAENLCQYKSRYSPIVEHILAFASSTNFVREVKNLSPNVKRIA